MLNHAWQFQVPSYWDVYCEILGEIAWLLWKEISADTPEITEVDSASME